MSARAAEYVVVSGFSAENLSQKVNARIKDGWQPHGNATFLISRQHNNGQRDLEAYQPMTRTAGDRIREQKVD